MLSAGSVVAGYRIERVLGSGGMGEVYLAAHPSLPRYDALKVLNAELSGDPDTFAPGSSGKMMSRPGWTTPTLCRSITAGKPTRVTCGSRCSSEAGWRRRSR